MKSLQQFKAKGKEFLGSLATPHDISLATAGIFLEVLEALEKVDADYLAQKVSGEIDIEKLADKISKSVANKIALSMPRGKK